MAGPAHTRQIYAYDPPQPPTNRRAYCEDKAALCLEVARIEQKGTKAVLKRMARLFKAKATPGHGDEWP